MDFLNLIQVADSAQSVLAILAAYLASVRGAAVLPDTLFNAPLKDVSHVEVRLAELMRLVTASSRALDGRRLRAAKQAMHVFAAAAWKLGARRTPRRGAA